MQIEGSDATRPHEPVRLAVDRRTRAIVFDEAGQALPHLDRHPLAA